MDIFELEMATYRIEHIHLSLILHPTEYLSCILRRIGIHPINRLAELLPWNIDLAPTPGEVL